MERNDSVNTRPRAHPFQWCRWVKRTETRIAIINGILIEAIRTARQDKRHHRLVCGRWQSYVATGQREEELSQEASVLQCGRTALSSSSTLWNVILLLINWLSCSEPGRVILPRLPPRLRKHAISPQGKKEIQRPLLCPGRRRRRRFITHKCRY